MVKLKHSPLRIVLFILIALAVTAVIHLFAPKVPVVEQVPLSEPAKKQDAEKLAQNYLEDIELKSKIAGLLMLHTPGTDPQKIAKFIEKYQPAGLILMDDNIPKSFDKLREITTAMHGKSEIPALIAIDEEGCSVKRLKDDIYPCAKDVKHQPPEASKTAYEQRSHLLKQAGINLNFGIVADMTNNQDSFIFPRVFGGEPKATGEHVAAAVAGTKGITYSTLKHFPGHGATKSDTHNTIPSIDQSKESWRKSHAVPFKHGIEAGADVTMFGHLAYTAVDNKPASLSKEWHNILLKDLGFKGITITDDMFMLQNSGDPAYSNPIKNAVEALNAGNSLLLFVTDHQSDKSKLDVQSLIDGVAKAVENGEISEEIIDYSSVNVIKFRQALSQI
jgi:beta-N-acetylhexosaminidase